MTTTYRHTTTTTSASPAATARAVLWTVVAVNAAVVQVLFLIGPPAKNPLVAVGQWLGLHVALLMMLQLTLVARIGWLDRRIGMDRLTSWHRWTGFLLLWTVVGHLTFVLLGYARADRSSVFGALLSLGAQVGVFFGLCAAAVVVVAATLSARAARRRMSYEAWHAVHLSLYAAVLLGLLHQLYEISFKASPAATAYWWALWVLVLGALLTGRVLVPVWRNLRHRFRVEAVVPESADVVSVYVTGRNLDRLPARAGQFCIWRFPALQGWFTANPFSLSAAPDGRTLRLTAKAVGDTSAALRRVPVGSRVFLEGPYGAFTAAQRTREASLLVAGGVGVTPVRALLEVLTGSVIVLYRVRDTADAVLLEELRALADARGARLHVLAGRTGPGNEPFAPENLRALVSDVAERDVYVCGPPAMTAAVLHGLRGLGVPRRQVHAERFALAS